MVNHLLTLSVFSGDTEYKSD